VRLRRFDASVAQFQLATYALLDENRE